jgi:DNA invertase Pin-like site-specific DNA recombinase
LRALCDGQVGTVFCIEASRLARNGRKWHTLLDFCGIVDALLIDAKTIYPKLTNDRLLLGMKGTISEMEVATFRERAQAALLQKAQRGALVVGIRGDISQLGNEGRARPKPPRP